MPIGFSTLKDYARLDNTILFSNYRTENGKSISYSLKLSNLIKPDYNYQLEVERRDYSPANQIVKFEEDGATEKVVYKEQTSKLFAAKIYSDLMGFKKDDPQGIIQVEVEKKLNIFTWRKQFRQWHNWGVISYTKPMITLSKLEEKDKGLFLRYRDDYKHNLTEPVKYASTLDLFRHEIFSIGNEMNLFLLDSRSLKSTLFIDGGFLFGQSEVIDSLWVYKNGKIAFSENPDNYKVNVLRFYPKATISVYPDERYSFSASYSHSWYYAMTNDFVQVANSDYYAATGKDSEHYGRNQFNSVELKAKIKLDKSTTGNWFLRYRYNWQQRFWNTGFSQLQLGYKMYIMTDHKKVQSYVPNGN
ncbi:MAG: hypothetical protein GXO89_13070 [Chlorobi bacterium]|nr:hypothetical protein [Chlorobiota bacterium]